MIERKGLINQELYNNTNAVEVFSVSEETIVQWATLASDVLIC
jgi:hypothetical protein